jgi:hypothetical protein
MSKIEKVKTHLHENKKFYIGLGVGICIAGITYTIMRGRYEALATSGAYGLKTADTSVTMRPLFFMSRQNSVVSVVSRSGRGHPGYIIQNLDTGVYFSSQREAAKAFNISETLLSKHLAGKIADVAGFSFERINMAM